MAQGTDREQMKEIMRGLAMISQVGLVMVACILLGFLSGLWLAGTWGGIIGLVLGVSAGFLNCYRMLIARIESGEPPDQPKSSSNDSSGKIQG